MYRKNAFFITLFLWMILGICASVAVYRMGLSGKETLANREPETQFSVPPETEVTPPETETTVPEPIPPLPTETEEPEPEYIFTVVDVFTRLRIRKEPSADAEILGYMHTGDYGQVLEIDEKWLHIRYESTEGYVSRRYVTLEEATP